MARRRRGPLPLVELDALPPLSPANCWRGQALRPPRGGAVLCRRCRRGPRAAVPAPHRCRPFPPARPVAASQAPGRRFHPPAPPFPRLGPAATLLCLESRAAGAAAACPAGGGRTASEQPSVSVCVACPAGYRLPGGVPPALHLETDQRLARLRLRRSPCRQSPARRGRYLARWLRPVPGGRLARPPDGTRQPGGRRKRGDIDPRLRVNLGTGMFSSLHTCG